MSSATVPSSPRPASGTPWILDSWRDLALIVAAPLLVLAGISLAQRRWSGEEITTFALVFAIGHHLPGMLRAYGDRALFARFRARFIFAPIFLAAIAAAASVWDLKSVVLVAAGWGWWHYLAQAYGFMRIYDGKAGSNSAATRGLDKAMCVTWFAAAVLLTPNALPVFLDLYYKCGAPAVSPAAVAGARLAATWITAAVTIAFLAHLVWSCANGRPPSGVKLLLMAGTFGFYWYSLATVENVLVAYALFELFHDVQYLTIVWAFSRGRAERDPGAGGFVRFLFRQRGWLVALYVVLVVAYGSLNYGANRLEEGTARRILVGLFLGSTLLHYYYDGFIWRLRERSTRQPLGLKEDSAAPARVTPIPAGWRHAALWGVFLVPVLYLSWLQMERQQGMGGKLLPAHWQAIAAVVPENAQVHYNLGTAFEQQGELAEAAGEYRRALAIKGNYEKAHYNLAGALSRMGQPAEAAAHYETAVRLRPRNASAWNNLGAVRLAQRDFARALTAFEQAAALEPGTRGFAVNLAAAHFHLAEEHEAAGRRDEAVAHCRAAARLNPGEARLARQIDALRERLDRATRSPRR